MEAVKIHLFKRDCYEFISTTYNIFELGVGEFRIVTTEAVYQIKVSRDLVEAVEPKENNKPMIFQCNQDQCTFYQNLSEEIFAKVGKLARKLSVSVEELPAELGPGCLDNTDQKLEHAKGQLEEIIKMTEDASMAIMDKADEIHQDMDQLKKQLSKLEELDVLTQSDSPLPSAEQNDVNIPAMPISSSGALETTQQLRELLQALLNRSSLPSTAEALIDDLDEDVPSPAPSEAIEEAVIIPSNESTPVMKKITVTSFDLDVVFQTLYELCTNESVKDHIKMMREGQHSDFNAEEIANQLSEISGTVDHEDGFYNFPITSILKTLYGATKSENFKTILKKMNQTAASIFLDSVLPVEGQSREIEIPDESAVAPIAPEVPEPVLDVQPLPDTPSTDIGEALPSPSDSELHIGGILCSTEELRNMMALTEEIEASLEKQQDVQSSDTISGSADESCQYAYISQHERDTLLKSVSTARQLIQKVGNHLTGILESLSFQDLSGQRIKKVVSVIGEVQMQLISILISINTKIKMHRESESSDIPVEDTKTEAMAQEEVNKVMEKLSTPSHLSGPGAEAKLDQDAVNDLLAQLGF